MAGYLSKSAALAGAAVTGRGDLVADVASGRQTLAGVDDADLPDHLRSMTPAERQAAIDRSLAERKRLSERMAELVGKRDRYVMERRKSAPAMAADSFDRAVAATLRAQIRR
jgi:hypothetical protein